LEGNHFSKVKLLNFFVENKIDFVIIFSDSFIGIFILLLIGGLIDLSFKYYLFSWS
jgi:hypothetical protein